MNIIEKLEDLVIFISKKKKTLLMLKSLKTKHDVAL